MIATIDRAHCIHKGTLHDSIVICQFLIECSEKLQITSSLGETAYRSVLITKTDID